MQEKEYPMFLEKIQTNQLEAKRELEIQNENTVGKTLYPRPFKQNSKQQGLQLLDRSHSPQKYGCYALFILTTLCKLAASSIHSRNIYLANSTNLKGGRLLCPETANESQTS